MSPTLRRFAIYGAAAPLVAGLCYFGFVYEVPPDPEHALLQAEVKLRFAARLPTHRADGSVVEARAAMIAEAVAFLDEAERLAPPSAATVEYRAYVDYLRGDNRAAAAGYSRASALAQDDEARDSLALSVARMLALAGDDAGALAQIDAHVPAASRVAAAASLERARILQRQGRVADATATARALIDNVSASGADLTGAGELLEICGDHVTAAAAYERAAPMYPLATYFTARLKAGAGDVDNALKMLERAVVDAGDMVRTLVERDVTMWQPCSTAERFQKLFPEMEAARPGR